MKPADCKFISICRDQGHLLLMVRKLAKTQQSNCSCASVVVLCGCIKLINYLSQILSVKVGSKNSSFHRQVGHIIDHPFIFHLDYYTFSSSLLHINAAKQLVKDNSKNSKRYTSSKSLQVVKHIFTVQGYILHLKQAQPTKSC